MIVQGCLVGYQNTIICYALFRICITEPKGTSNIIFFKDNSAFVTWIISINISVKRIRLVVVIVLRSCSYCSFDLILPNFGYTSIKLLAERGTKVRLITSPSIKAVHFTSESTDNITIKEFKDSKIGSPSPKLGYTILICRKEVHAEKLGENIYSDDPMVISDLQSDFNTLWDLVGGKNEENRDTQSTPRSSGLRSKRKQDRI